eukprot:Gb_16663 [translate_table: standard]
MKSKILIPIDKLRVRVVNGCDDDVEEEGGGSDVVNIVVTISRVREVLCEEDEKVDVLERAQTKVVEGDIVGNERNPLNGIVEILNPFKDSPMTLEFDVVEGPPKHTLSCIPPPPNLQDIGKIDPLLKSSASRLCPPYYEGTPSASLLFHRDPNTSWFKSLWGSPPYGGWGAMRMNVVEPGPVGRPNASVHRASRLIPGWR